MLDHEYKKKMGYIEKRSWTLTFICVLLAVAILVGIFGLLRYVAHDAYTVFAVAVPAGIIIFMLIIGAINGRKSVVKEAFAGVIELVVFWR